MKIVPLLVFSFVVVSCGKEKLDQYDTSQISVHLVNASGNPTTSFREGEVPVVIFKVVNLEGELRLNPALHYGEHILLYNDGFGTVPIGNFYANGQLANIIVPSIYKGQTKTTIIFPWIWTADLEAEIIEYSLDGEEQDRQATSNSFSAPDNLPLGKGEYTVRLSLPDEWGVPVGKDEINFSIN